MVKFATFQEQTHFRNVIIFEKADTLLEASLRLDRALPYSKAVQTVGASLECNRARFDRRRSFHIGGGSDRESPSKLADFSSDPDVVHWAFGRSVLIARTAG